MEYLEKINLGNLSINSRTQDDQTWLIASNNDISPTRYYKYDRHNKKVEFLFSSRSELEKYPLSPMTPIIIKSRDGLNLISYLTLPKNISLFDSLHQSKPVPLVLYVHGGPWCRNIWGMNNIQQWLANRGYAVLTVNYRGSSGFGKKFLNAGNGQWGKKMHDDLIDAVNWAVQNNIADPKKIAIIGAS